jgi:4-alpha-glucanotransferase
MAQQMEKLSAKGLYLDFPLGVNGGGYDVEKYGHVFAKGASVGAPPDSFFTKGQNWGFPPFHPEALRADRYRYFRAAIAHHARHASILRLDHVMGLHRLYWIPDGMDAKDGVYVRYHDEELYAIVVLESVRNRCAIIGEDLGTVPEYVPEAMQRHGLRRMYVVQYEAKPKTLSLSDPSPASVASINTHDMPTFAAFWSGKDVDDRVEQGLLDDKGAQKERNTRAKLREKIEKQLGKHDVLQNILTFLANSDAEVVLINLEDLWGETEPQNVPGVPEKSWKQRFRLSLEEARKDERVMGILGTFTRSS